MKPEQIERIGNKMMVDALNCLAETCHDGSVENGWYEYDDEHPELKPADFLMLMVQELTEAYDHLRDGHGLTEVWYQEGVKPDGFPVEMADTIIRVLDYCAYLEIDIGTLVMQKLAYNRTRGKRHGGKVY